MLKNITVIGFLLFAVAFNTYAHDSDRVDQLEKEIQDLKARLSKLESLLSSLGNSDKPIAPGEGWKSVTNWRKLTTDMGTSDVQRILGDPNRVDGGTLTIWYYQNRGVVMFINGRVSSWTEPRQ